MDNWASGIDAATAMAGQKEVQFHLEGRKERDKFEKDCPPARSTFWSGFCQVFPHFPSEYSGSPPKMKKSNKRGSLRLQEAS